MQCDRAQELIGAYLDDELVGAEREAVAAHVKSCPRCELEANDLRRLAHSVAIVVREVASPSLGARIRTELVAADTAPAAGLADASLAGIGADNNAVPPRHRFTEPRLSIAALAASCLLTAALTLSAVHWSGTATNTEREIVSAHIRSLLHDRPTEIASSDQHTVKPWFMGRIDFAPDVKDLTLEGFPLAGGRVDYVGERRVGALVYRRRQHVVNVFVWPAASADMDAARAHLRKGYNMLTWSRGGVTYWAISDLNMGELRQLQSLL